MSKIAAYMRISVAEKHENRVEDTINSQRNIIEAYLKSKEEFKNVTIEDFIDEGYSGNTISRPSLDRLIGKIKRREIDCIIVKDMSRFMRNYIEMGNYLENIFPFMGIRFIAINDGYDSNTEIRNGTGIDIQFKNLMNDYYCRELSQKMKTTLQTCYKNGKYVTGNPPYGYKKDPDDHTKIIVDREIAENVRYIFQLALEGKTLFQIAKIINEKGIITPGKKRFLDLGYDCFISRNKHDINKSVWQHSMVRRVLINETYTGTFVYNKSRKTKLDGGKYELNDKANWKRIPNHHEAIISQEIFDEVQKLLNSRARKIDNTRKNPKELLRGIVKCNHCGYTLSIINHRDKSWLYCRHCRSQSLTPKFVDADLVEKEIINILRSNYNMSNEKIQELEAEKKKLLISNERLIQKKISYFEEYKLEKIDRESFRRIKENVQMDLEINKERVDEIDKKLNEVNNTEIFTNEDVKKYIDKIIVSDEGIEEIIYK